MKPQLDLTTKYFLSWTLAKPQEQQVSNIPTCVKSWLRSSRKSRKLPSLICARDTTIPEINVAARTQEFAMAARLGIDEELPKWLDADYGHVITPLVKETLGYTMSNFLSDPIFRGELRKNLWDNDLVETAFQNLNEQIHELMKTTFERLVDDAHTRPRLAEMAKEIWDEHLSKASSNLQKHNKLMFIAEQNQTFTINHYYEETLSKVKKLADDYIKMIKTTKQFDTLEQDLSHLEAAEKELDLPNGFIKRYAKTISVDALTHSVIELQLSLYCYVKVFLKRICDWGAIMARQILVLGPHSDIHNMFGNISDPVLTKVLAEDKKATARRTKLIRSIEHLESNLKRLQNCI